MFNKKQGCIAAFVKVVCALTAVTFYATEATAFELDPKAIRGSKSKTPVSVLQNRFFLKSFRPEAGIIMGSFLNEAYTDTTVMGVRGGMFFTEWAGIEVQYMKANVDDTDDRRALNSLEYFEKVEGSNGDAVPSNKIVTPDPEVNPIKGITDFNAVIAPFYGKLNLFNKLIVYSDLYVTTGMAQVDTEQGMKTAFSVGAGQRFYMQENFSVRVDFRDRIYTEERAGKDSRKNAISFDLGASYFFN
jgi:outer membrane beta-barrel protein